MAIRLAPSVPRLLVRSLAATTLLLGACGSGSPVAPDDHRSTSEHAGAQAGGETGAVALPITAAALPLTTSPETLAERPGGSAKEPAEETANAAAPAPAPAPALEPEPEPEPATDATSEDAAGGPVACATFSASDRDAILARLNAARAEARSCGSERHAATLPLVWDTRLEDAAMGHSIDMATHDFFSHTGSDGSQIGDRVSDAGYELRRAGENIAAGQASDQAALDGWLSSEGHCRNIMEPTYRDVALACVSDAGSTYTRYWTQVFGAVQ